MLDGFRFTVIVVDGEVVDMGDLSTSSIRYDGLTWEESAELARLSFAQGFEIVVWKMDDTGEKE